MKISTEIGSIARLVGEEKAIELCAKAGFDAWDFTMLDMAKYDWASHSMVESGHPLSNGDYLAFARRLKRIGLDNGIVCNQSHAPFPSYCPEIKSRLMRAIECTAEAGGKICVIHPDNFASAEKNAEMYLELLPFAKDCGVKIATENMFGRNEKTGEPSPAACSSAEDFVRHIEAVNDEIFVACLDIGHAEMRTAGDGAVKMIRALGSSLQALHIHDNNRFDDFHRIPFSDSIDFASVVSALKEISYKGDLTLEANTHLKKYSPEDAYLGVSELAESAKKLRDMF